jgi:hypothetical protein
MESCYRSISFLGGTVVAAILAPYSPHFHKQVSKKLLNNYEGKIKLLYAALY